MKVAYIAHPLGQGEDREKNRARASRWVSWAARQGVAPVADWIILAGEWPETDENRALGLAIDCALVERCNELWLVGGRISPGMAIEAEHAKKRGRTVVDLTHLGEESPEDQAAGRVGGAGGTGSGSSPKPQAPGPSNG